jgi:AAA domain
MTNVVIYLIGYFGIGKYTIAKALADVLPCKIIDNHYVLNPIFNLLENDGVTPLPPLVWLEAAKVREAVLETIRFLSPREWNFVFTNDLSEDETSHRLFDDVAQIAKARGSTLVPVLLSCDEDEYLRRVVRPERRERLKGINAAEARERFQSGSAFQIAHSNVLRLDVTALQPNDAANLILGHIRQTRR